MSEQEHERDPANPDVPDAPAEDAAVATEEAPSKLRQDVEIKDSDGL